MNVRVTWNVPYCLVCTHSGDEGCVLRALAFPFRRTFLFFLIPEATRKYQVYVVSKDRYILLSLFSLKPIASAFTLTFLGLSIRDAVKDTYGQ